MKTALTLSCLSALCLGLAICGCGKKDFTSWKYIQNPELAEQLKRFAAEKEALANANTNPMRAEFKRVFAAAKRGDWLAVTNIYVNLGHRDRYNYTDPDPWWETIPGETILDIYGAFGAFAEGGEKYNMLYGNDIIQSIPRGSIYLPWTGPGYSIVAVMQKSQGGGDPFFTMSQQALNEYDYLHSMYGGKIYTPTYQDAKHCTDELLAEINSRMRNFGGDKPDYDSPDFIWGMDRMLARVVFDENTNREFYVEGISWGWMYPLLEPHGLIFKLNRQPLAQLSDEIVQKDHDYWTNAIAPMIGPWLDNETPLSNVVAFNEKVFLHHDFNGFTGDTDFVRNSYANRMFSKERSSIAGLYAWRAAHSEDPSEKECMARAADFAFRQAWALCPVSEAVFRYAAFLMDEKRLADALLVAETAEKLAPDQGQADQLNQLVEQLKRYQNK